METVMEGSLPSSESHEGPADTNSSITDGESDTWAQYDPNRDDVARNQSKCEKRDFCSQTKPMSDYPTVSGYTNKFMKFLDNLDREMAPIKSGIRDLQHQVMELGILEMNNLNTIENFPQITPNANAQQCCNKTFSDSNHSFAHSDGTAHTCHSLPLSNGTVHASHHLPPADGIVQYVGKVVSRKSKDPCEIKRTERSSSYLSTFTSSSQRSHKSNSNFQEQGTAVRMVSDSHSHQSKPAIEIYIVASPEAFPKLTAVKQQPSYCYKI